MQFSQASSYFLLGLDMFLDLLISDNLSPCSSLNVKTKFHTHLKQQAKLHFGIY
jgi:hypothetical protein